MRDNFPLLLQTSCMNLDLEALIFKHLSLSGINRTEDFELGMGARAPNSAFRHLNGNSLILNCLICWCERDALPFGKLHHLFHRVQGISHASHTYLHSTD